MWNPKNVKLYDYEKTTINTRDDAVADSNNGK